MPGALRREKSFVKLLVTLQPIIYNLKSEIV